MAIAKAGIPASLGTVGTVIVPALLWHVGHAAHCNKRQLGSCRAADLLAVLLEREVAVAAIAKRPVVRFTLHAARGRVSIAVKMRAPTLESQPNAVPP